MMIFQVFIPVIDDIYNLFIHKKYLRGEYVVTKLMHWSVAEHSFYNTWICKVSMNKWHIIFLQEKSEKVIDTILKYYLIQVLFWPQKK